MRRGTEAGSPRSDSVDKDLKNLSALRHSIDFEALATVAPKFYTSSRILILAGDLAATLAAYLEHHLTILGLPVLSATSWGRIMHLARSTGKKDLVIAISFRKGLRQTVEGLSRHTATEHIAWALQIPMCRRLPNLATKFSWLQSKLLRSVLLISFPWRFLMPFWWPAPPIGELVLSHSCVQQTKKSDMVRAGTRRSLVSLESFGFAIGCHRASCEAYRVCRVES